MTLRIKHTLFLMAAWACFCFSLQTDCATIPCHLVAQGTVISQTILRHSVHAPESSTIGYIRVRTNFKEEPPVALDDINPYARSWGGDAAVFGRQPVWGAKPNMCVRMEWAGAEDYRAKKREYEYAVSSTQNQISHLQASGASKDDILEEKKYLDRLNANWKLAQKAAQREHQMKNESSMGILHHLSAVTWGIILPLLAVGCWLWLVLVHIRPKRVLLWLFWGTIIAGSAGYAAYDALQRPTQTQGKNKRTTGNLWKAEERRLLDEMIECDEGSPYAVRLLAIRHGGDVNACLPSAEHTGVTALMWASQEGHSDIVRILLEKEANPNSKIRSGEGKGFTALMFAAQNGHTGIVRMLQNKGASPNDSPPYQNDQNGMMEPD